MSNTPIDFDESAYYAGYQKGWIRGFSIGSVMIILLMIIAFFIDIQIHFS